MIPSNILAPWQSPRITIRKMAPMTTLRSWGHVVHNWRRCAWYSCTCSPEEQITLLLPALWSALYQKRMLAEKMAFQQTPTKDRSSFLCNCINSLICDRAYWWDFVFNLSTSTFYGCNSFYCSSLLCQWSASFDQMIKVHCCICKTYVYWIYFIATLFLPHLAQSAVHTCALSSIWSHWFVVGVATTNWNSPRVMHCF